MSQVLGALFAVLVGLMIIPTFGRYQQVSNDNSRAVATAQQQQQLMNAAKEYIQQNAAALQANATSNTPAIITVSMLQNTNLLPAAFVATNPYGQTWTVQVLQPSAGTLQALVSATNGANIPDAQASKIASIVGASGGFLPLNDSGLYQAGQAYGSYGGWVLPTAGYAVSGGHPAGLVSYSSGQTASNYLYRNAVPGQPQLNRMNTALDMNANDLNNAGKVGIGTENPTNPLTINNQSFYPAQNVNSGVMIGPPNGAAYGGGILMKDYSHYAGMWTTENGATLNFGAGGTSSGFGSPYGKVSIDKDGNVAAAGSVAVPQGNNLKVGNTLYYGDANNSAVRQNGDFYVQHYDGQPADLISKNIIASGGSVVVATNDWTLGGRDANWTNNSAPQSSVGSANLNDVYLRSIDKWASQLGAGISNTCYTIYSGNDGALTCNSGYVVTGVRMSGVGCGGECVAHFITCCMLQ